MTATTGTADRAATYVLATSGGTTRVHRSTCKRIPAAASASAAAPASDSQAIHALASGAVEASCCKPNIHRIPAVTRAEPGRGELAGGDVQALPREGKPRARKETRHDQRTPLPPRGATTRGDSHAASAAALLTPVPPRAKSAATAASAEGERTCAGACGRTLPLVKFPTAGKDAEGTMRRGKECRECRDARREARASA